MIDINVNPSAIRDNRGRGKVGDFLKDKIRIGSKLSIAYCPYCRVVTNQSVVIIPYLTTAPNGEERLVASGTYHCEICGLFVRSEEGVLHGSV